MQAAADLPADRVYAGFSLGVLPAQKLAQTRSGARGALFFHSWVPASEFGTLPAGVPVQVHAMESDPFFVDDGDTDAALKLVEEAAEAELFLYSGDQHLFVESFLPSYNAEASALPDTARARLPRDPAVRRSTLSAAVTPLHYCR